MSNPAMSAYVYTFQHHQSDEPPSKWVQPQHRIPSDTIAHTSRDYSRSPDGNRRPTISGVSTRRRACDLCYRRKLRCDGIQPLCGTCQRLGHNCNYSRLRERVSKGSSLKQRVAQLERQLKLQGLQPEPDLGARSMHGHDDLTPDMSHHEQDIELDPYQHNTSTEDTKIHTLKEFRASSGNAPGSRTVSVLESEPPNLTAESIQFLERLFFFPCSCSGQLFEPNRMYPLISHETYLSSPPCVKYMVLAISALSNSQDFYAKLAQPLYEYARSLLLALESDPEESRRQSMNVIRATLMRAIFEHRSEERNDAWMSSGSALRRAIMIGLNTIDFSDIQCEGVLPEENRRLFWCLFYSVRLLGLSNGLYGGIAAEAIDTSLCTWPSPPGQPAKRIRLIDLDMDNERSYEPLCIVGLISVAVEFFEHVRTFKSGQSGSSTKSQKQIMESFDLLERRLFVFQKYCQHFVENRSNKESSSVIVELAALQLHVCFTFIALYAHAMEGFTTSVSQSLQSPLFPPSGFSSFPATETHREFLCQSDPDKVYDPTTLHVKLKSACVDLVLCILPVSQAASPHPSLELSSITEARTDTLRPLHVELGLFNAPAAVFLYKTSLAILSIMEFAARPISKESLIDDISRTELRMCFEIIKCILSGFQQTGRAPCAAQHLLQIAENVEDSGLAISSITLDPLIPEHCSSTDQLDKLRGLRLMLGR